MVENNQKQNVIDKIVKIEKDVPTFNTYYPEKKEFILCDMCGHSNPIDTAICEMCSNYIRRDFKWESI